MLGSPRNDASPSLFYVWSRLCNIEIIYVFKSVLVYKFDGKMSFFLYSLIHSMSSVYLCSGSSPMDFFSV